MDEWQSPNEDWRGVDVTQIRALLRLTVAERAREMVRVANAMAEARESAARARAVAP